MMRRRWWDGLSDLERAQHHVKSARGQFNIWERFASKVGFLRDPRYHDEIERARLVLRA